MLTIYIVLSVLVLVFIFFRNPIFSHSYIFLWMCLTASFILLPLYHSVFVTLLTLVIILPTLRLIYLVAQEVYFAAGRLDTKDFSRGLIRVLVLWLPFPLMAVTGYWMLSIRDHKVYTNVDAFVYETQLGNSIYGCGKSLHLVCRCEYFRSQTSNTLANTALNQSDCPTVNPSIYRISENANDMQRDIHIAYERLTNAFRKDIVSRLTSNIERTTDSIEEYNSDIESALFGRGHPFYDNPPIAYRLQDYHPNLKSPECTGVIDQLFKLRKCIKNISLEPPNQAYLSIRHELKSQIGLNKSRFDTTHDIPTLVEDIVDQNLIQYSKKAHRSIDSIFKILKVLDRILLIFWLAIVSVALLSGFLYIFVRYIYNSHHGKALFSIANGDIDKDVTVRSTLAPPQIKVADITIDGSINHFHQELEETSWYATIDSSLRYEVDGIICIPRPLTLLFKRFPKRLFMFRYSKKDGKQDISAYADGLSRFIKIELIKGQSICFEVNNLVAFSDRIKLTSTLNLPLAAFFQSQLFFSTATGPGELILRVTNGKPDIMPSEAIKPSDPRDIVSFEKNGIYSLLADLNPLSVYCLGHRVVPNGNTFLVRQSPDTKGSLSSQASAIRRSLYLLLPLTFITIVLPWLLP